MKKGFTLAEVMIVLAVIGIISAIVMPIARQAIPDKNVMLFKKGHNTLFRVITELVNSDEYYKDGDLGMKADGTQVGGEAQNAYFCNSVADLISTKSVSCVDNATSVANFVVGTGSLNIAILNKSNDVVACEALTSGNYTYTITDEDIEKARESLDTKCKKSKAESRVVSSDGVTFFETSATLRFGSTGGKGAGGCSSTPGALPRWFSPPNIPAIYHDQNGMDINYKPYCIDIDGVPASGSEGCDDKTDICPFGYGIRADGKILNGKRAQEWLEKDFQGED